MIAQVELPTVMHTGNDRPPRRHAESSTTVTKRLCGRRDDADHAAKAASRRGIIDRRLSGRLANPSQLEIVRESIEHLHRRHQVVVRNVGQRPDRHDLEEPNHAAERQPPTGDLR